MKIQTQRSAMLPTIPKGLESELSKYLDDLSSVLRGMSKTTNDDLSNLGVPTGAVLPFGGSSAPKGYLMCDGTSYLRSDYGGLFDVIGTTYGAADSTHFSVPDIRGIFIKGAGTTNRAAGVNAAGSYYSGTRGTYSQDQMQGHLHRYYRVLNGYTLSSDDANYDVPCEAGADRTTKNTGGPITDGTNGTPRTGYTTEPQSLGMNHIIKI